MSSSHSSVILYYSDKTFKLVIVFVTWIPRRNLLKKTKEYDWKMPEDSFLCPILFSSSLKNGSKWSKSCQLFVSKKVLPSVSNLVMTAQFCTFVPKKPFLSMIETTESAGSGAVVSNAPQQDGFMLTHTRTHTHDHAHTHTHRVKM